MPHEIQAIDQDSVTLFDQVLVRPPYVPAGEWREKWLSVRDVFDEQSESPEELEKTIAGLEQRLQEGEDAMDELQKESEALIEFKDIVEKALKALP